MLDETVFVVTHLHFHNSGNKAPNKGWTSFITINRNISQEHSPKRSKGDALRTVLKVYSDDYYLTKLDDKKVNNFRVVC